MVSEHFASTGAGRCRDLHFSGGWCRPAVAIVVAFPQQNIYSCTSITQPNGILIPQPGTSEEGVDQDVSVLPQTLPTRRCVFEARGETVNSELTPFPFQPTSAETFRCPT